MRMVTEFPKQELTDLVDAILSGTLLSDIPGNLAKLFKVLAYVLFLMRSEDPEGPIIGDSSTDVGEESTTEEVFADGVAVELTGEERMLFAELLNACGEEVPAGGFLDDILLKKVKELALKYVKDLLDELKEDPEKIVELVKQFLEMIFD